MIAPPAGARSSGDTATATSSTAQPAGHGAPKLVIIAFGSSSTEGVGASSPAAAYPNRMQTELRSALAPTAVTVINRGIGGEDVDDMMKRLPGIIAEKPDMIVWQTGTNDPIRQVPLKRFVTKTRMGLHAMQEAHIAAILMEPQDCAVLRAIPGSMRYRDAVRAIGAEFDVPVIKRWDLMQNWLDRGALTETTMMYTDGLHMTDGGYALLAHAVARQILAMHSEAVPKANHADKEKPAPQDDAGLTKAAKP